MPTSVEARRVVPLPQLARAADALPGGAPTIGRRLASHGFLLGLLGVVLLGAALRVPGLADFPPGLLQDEAQIGYDAYSVLRTGRDHHGDRLPINFRSFNDYLPGLYFYLAMPTIALFGLEPVAVRLPAAILGLIAVVATGFAARRLAGTGPGLAAALFLAVSPGPWPGHRGRCRPPGSERSAGRVAEAGGLASGACGPGLRAGGLVLS